MNSLNVIGRIGKDAVLRNTQNGDAVLGFSLAFDSGFGEKKQTIWLDCSMWGKRGEKIAEYLTKGKQIGVSGELGTREHEGRTYLTLRVSDVTLCGGKDEERAPRQQAPARAPVAQSDDFREDDIPFN